MAGLGNTKQLPGETEGEYYARISRIVGYGEQQNPAAAAALAARRSLHAAPVHQTSDARRYFEYAVTDNLPDATINVLYQLARIDSPSQLKPNSLGPDNPDSNMEDACQMFRNTLAYNTARDANVLTLELAWLYHPRQRQLCIDAKERVGLVNRYSVQKSRQIKWARLVEGKAESTVFDEKEIRSIIIVGRDADGSLVTPVDIREEQMTSDTDTKVLRKNTSGLSIQQFYYQAELPADRSFKPSRKLARELLRFYGVYKEVTPLSQPTDSYFVSFHAVDRDGAYLQRGAPLCLTSDGRYYHGVMLLWT